MIRGLCLLPPVLGFRRRRAGRALADADGGFGDFSPDSTQIVYSPQSRIFARRSATAAARRMRLHFDLKTYANKRVAEGPRATRDPIWIGDTIYYNSDRDGHFNLYAYDIASGKTTLVTSNNVWDVRWPSSDNQGRIVYELNGEIQVLEAGSRAVTYSISVRRRPGASTRSHPAALNRTVGLSPRASARCLSPAATFLRTYRKGPTRNLTHSSGAHDKWASWSRMARKSLSFCIGSGEEERTSLTRTD